MSDLTWKVLVDWDGDGDFGDVNEDVSSYFMEGDWSIGMRQPYQLVADQAKANLVFKNATKDWSPEYGSGAFAGTLDIGLQVRIQSVTSAEGTINRFTGWIEDIEPSILETGDRRTRIRVLGPKRQLERANVYVELLQDVRSDEAIGTILNAVGTIVGSGERDFEEGVSTWSYVGDTWKEGVSAARAIADLCSGERGRFHFNAGGTAVFWNRYHLPTDTSVAGTIDALRSAGYKFAGDSIKNIVRIQYTPRKLSAGTAETLWALDEATVIAPGEARDIRASFGEQDSDAKVSGLNVGTPGTADSSLSFSPASASLAVTMEAKANSATLTLTNNDTVDITVDTLIVKGQKLTAYNQQSVEAQDSASIAAYLPREMNIQASVIDESEFPKRLVEYELERRKDSRGEMSEISLMQSHNLTHVGQMVSLGVGSRINVTDAQTSHDKDYHIIGERWTVRNAGREANLTWTLEPADTHNLFTIGVDSLGGTAVLAP